ncbi:LysR family transcriptional regulator [Actinoplanes friuliensis DSM 7358]|uniref:LysR family transcriptional regulator n=1 Tax=Actinoplanes friuliensis DSM 7358 TaxID=1246995 RepID=U5VY95_9ACTN|nr:LysR family transcriptional regulator [Actinoplanes friuliensis DSM 7358]
MRHFLTLAEELNYGRAAAILHLAQPALSRSIATLERELGVVLFDRSRSGTRLAPAGEILRDEARQLLRSADTLKRRVREGRTVTIGFAPGLIVTPVVRHLEERFPEHRSGFCRGLLPPSRSVIRSRCRSAAFTGLPGRRGPPEFRGPSGTRAVRRQC